jgi:hypothetical protein
MLFLNLQNTGMAKVVVMAVADNNHVDYGYVRKMTWSFCISLWAHKGEG